MSETNIYDGISYNNLYTQQVVLCYQRSQNFNLRHYYVIMTSSNRGKIYRISEENCLF